VVLEAGGHVTDVTGKNLDFSRGHQLNQNRGVIVTNGKLHNAIVDTVQAVMATQATAGLMPAGQPDGGAIRANLT